MWRFDAPSPQKAGAAAPERNRALVHKMSTLPCRRRRKTRRGRRSGAGERLRAFAAAARTILTRAVTPACDAAPPAALHGREIDADNVLDLVQEA